MLKLSTVKPNPNNPRVINEAKRVEFNLIKELDNSERTANAE